MKELWQRNGSQGATRVEVRLSNGHCLEHWLGFHALARLKGPLGGVILSNVRAGITLNSAPENPNPAQGKPQQKPPVFLRSSPLWALSLQVPTLVARGTSTQERDEASS